MSDSGYGHKGELVLRELRALIGAGELVPGEHLRQDEVATRLSTSRVPVREAFKVLVSEGVIEHRRNQGHFVAHVSGEEMKQLVWLRDTAEAHLASSSELPDPVTLATMVQANAGLVRVLASDPGDVRLIAPLDHAFHSALWSLSPDTVIASQASLMWQRIAPYRTYVGYNAEILGRFVCEHEAIIDAVRSADTQSLVRAVEQHQRFTEGTIRRVTEAAEGVGEA